eukprot:scaffold2297_cov102-Isochrysis_galbana.AAC.9
MWRHGTGGDARIGRARGVGGRGGWRCGGEDVAGEEKGYGCTAVARVNVRPATTHSPRLLSPHLL